MKKYDILREYKDKEIRRITGVKRTTFEKMVKIVEVAYMAKQCQQLKDFSHQLTFQL